ncbi:MAG: glycosyltransferase family 4 protein [Candidatus Binataceae bacterium]
MEQAQMAETCTREGAHRPRGAAAGAVARPYRLACLARHPIQYQAPLFRHLARNPALELTVFFLSSHGAEQHDDPGFGVRFNWDVPLLGGYRHEFLPCVGRRDALSFWQPYSYGLTSRLRAGGYDALWVNGYAHQAALRAIAAARRNGLKVLMRGESHLASHPRSPARAVAKGLVLRPLFRAIDAFLAIGALNRDYYIHYGADAHRVFMTPYSVDNVFFRSRAELAHVKREEFRRELGLESGRPVVLYASKLEQRKRPEDLLEAFIRLSANAGVEPRAYLLYVGDGERRAELEKRVGGLDWQSVRFLGFKNQTELPSYYDLCDVLVLPSEFEPWGLVVNEVMNAGKAVIVSDRVGAGRELVADRENGFVFPARDVSALTGRLRQLIDDPRLTKLMGDRSLTRITAWNFDATERGLLDALAAVTGRRAGIAVAM